jgi:hypothetical protein
MTDRFIRGRKRIVHEFNVSERTLSRQAADGLLEVSYEPAENNRVMVLDTWQQLGAVAGRLVARLSPDERDDGAQRA